MRTLGLSDRFMNDAWNHRLTYVVPKRFAEPGVDIDEVSAEDVTTMITIREKSIVFSN
jgi:hypothetical protein